MRIARGWLKLGYSGGQKEKSHARGRPGNASWCGISWSGRPDLNRQPLRDALLKTKPVGRYAPSSGGLIPRIARERESAVPRADSASLAAPLPPGGASAPPHPPRGRGFKSRQGYYCRKPFDSLRSLRAPLYPQRAVSEVAEGHERARGTRASRVVETRGFEPADPSLGATPASL